MKLQEDLINTPKKKTSTKEIDTLASFTRLLHGISNPREKRAKKETVDAVGIEPTTFHNGAYRKKLCEAKIIPLDQKPTYRSV